jgi:hypothetical protein
VPLARTFPAHRNPQTHNVALASPVADFVVALEDGCVVSQGSVTEAVACSPALLREVTEELELIKKVAGEEDSEPEPEPEPELEAAQADKEAEGRLVAEEEVHQGRVSWDARKSPQPHAYTRLMPRPAVNMFFSALGGAHSSLFWGTFLGALVFGDLVTAGQTYFAGWWAEQYALYPTGAVPVVRYACRFVNTSF